MMENNKENSPPAGIFKRKDLANTKKFQTQNPTNVPTITFRNIDIDNHVNTGTQGSFSNLINNSILSNINKNCTMGTTFINNNLNRSFSSNKNRDSSRKLTYSTSKADLEKMKTSVLVNMNNGEKHVISSSREKSLHFNRDIVQRQLNDSDNSDSDIGLNFQRNLGKNFNFGTTISAIQNTSPNESYKVKSILKVPKLRLEGNQTKNFKKFTIDYKIQQEKKKELKIVQDNFISYEPILSTNFNNNYIINPNINYDDEECLETSEFELEDIHNQHNINNIMKIEIHKNCLESDKDIINFNKLVKEFYQEKDIDFKNQTKINPEENSLNESKIEFLQTELKDLNLKLKKLNHLKLLHNQLSEKLNPYKNQGSKQNQLNESSMDDPIKKEIDSYVDIYNNKYEKYKRTLKKLLKAIKLGKKDMNLTDITREDYSKNNFITSVNKNRNNLQKLYYQEIIMPQNSSEEELKKFMVNLNPNLFKFQILPQYSEILDHLNEYKTEETITTNEKIVNIYKDQGLIKSQLNDGTQKFNFKDGFVLTLFKNGDISQNFNDEYFIHLHKEEELIEFNFQKKHFLKIIVLNSNYIELHHVEGTILSKSPNNQIIVKQVL